METVGKELLPRAKQVKTEGEFGLLCLELVARLEDSHAPLGSGTATPPVIPLPRFDPGFACLIDDRGKPVVYYVDRGGPAEKAGVRVGMTVLSIHGKAAEEVLADQMQQLRRYSAIPASAICDTMRPNSCRDRWNGAPVALEMRDVEGQTRKFSLPAAMDVRYLPRLPVPIPGIRDSGNVSWTISTPKIGYIYVRRIQSDLLEQLDRAVGELKGGRRLMVDVRGNSGGGFDRPGPIATSPSTTRKSPTAPVPRPDRDTDRLTLHQRRRGLGLVVCGQQAGPALRRDNRRRFVAEKTYTLKNGLYTVTFPVKAYTGFLDRPIERRGLEPDVPLRQNAGDLAAGRDTVLEAAKRYILEQK